MRIESRKVTHHGRTITVTFYAPDGVEKFPVIIFSHGYNGYKEDFDRSAKYFVANGIGAVCYTFCGGSSRDDSGFPTTNMTVFTETEDLTAGVGQVSTWETVDKDNLFLFGASQGGMISALVAEEQIEKVKGLILLFPAFCIPDDWNNRFKGKEEIPETFDLWGMTLGHEFFESLRGFLMYEHIGRYNGKVLLMHGTDDERVPIQYSEKAEKKYPQASLIKFPGEGHGFTVEGERRMEGMALYFVHTCLEGK